MNRRALLNPRLVLEELLRRSAKTFDPRGRLTPKAIEALNDPTRHRAWPAGRGAAKTTTAQWALIEAALSTPKCACVYLSDTIGRAKAVVWDELVEWSAAFGGKANHAELLIRFPNGSRIFVTGADSLKLFNRKRGIKRIKLVVFDEAQDWESAILEYAVTKVFMPRLGDLQAAHGIKGRIIIAGTGAAEAGYWFNVCSDPAFGFGVTRGWDQWSNPHIADPEGEFRDTCKANGVEVIDLTEPIYACPGARPRWVDCNDAMIRREFFAEFNAGGALQIFKPPFMLVPRALVPTGDVMLVICGDFGTVDAAAAGCWLLTRHDPRLWFVRVTRETGLSASKQVKLVRDFAHACELEYKPMVPPIIVGDGGGLGKALILDIQESERAGDVMPAEKTDKVPNMRLLAGALRDAEAVIVEDLKEFVKELRLPEWHPDHVGEKIRGHVPDQVDACYMGFRKARQIHVFQPDPPPKKEADRLEQRVFEEGERARSQDWIDRLDDF